MHAKVTLLASKHSLFKIYFIFSVIFDFYSYLCIRLPISGIPKLMPQRLYPIGLQTFERIRNENMLYVDKTKEIYHMTHTNGTYFFLSRPRRFGKSLLVSTLKSYFEGKKELFKGLAIEKLETEWKQYPVLHFSMASGKHMAREQLQRYLLYILEENEKPFGIKNDSVDPNVRLSNLISEVYRQTGRQVVILIDEYDAPLLDVAHDTESLDVLRNIMRNFYSPLKDSEPLLKFVFLTGITKFSQLSIFSELNNISNISMNETYANICGITKEELLTQMSESIDTLAGKRKLTREQAVEKLTKCYDGYHFAWPSSDIFNPYSLLNCFADGKFNSYWFGSGTPTYLINMMRKFDTLPTDMTHIEASADEFDAPTENLDNIVPLLYQSGYITIKDYDEDFDYYTLGIPNKEVKIGLTKALIPAYVTANTLNTTNTARRMAQCLVKDDMDGALRLLQAFLGTIPYCNQANSEGHFQQMLYIIFTLVSEYPVDVEVHTPKGRIDMVMMTSGRLFVVELKLDQSADAAMAQIDIKDYPQRFALAKKPVTKVAVNFDSKKGNITDWKIE